MCVGAQERVGVCVPHKNTVTAPVINFQGGNYYAPQSFSVHSDENQYELHFPKSATTKLAFGH